MSTPTFEEIVRAWALHYDDRLPSERSARREAFIVLLGNLSDYGFGKEELTNTRKERIIKTCVNPNHKDKKKLRTWISLCVNDLEAATLLYWGTVKIREDVVTQDMRDKLEAGVKKAEESKQLRLVAGPSDPDADQANEEEFSIEDDSKIDLTQDKPKFTEGKVVPITDEELEKMSGPEAVWDEELMEKLGIEFNE